VQLFGYAGSSSSLRQRLSWQKVDVMPVFPPGTRAQGKISYLDAGNEPAPFSTWLPVITAENLEDQEGFWAAFLTQADNMTLGTRRSDQYIDKTSYVVTRPTNGAAREIALKIIFRSAVTGQTWDSLLPTLDLTKVTYIQNYGAKDIVNMAGTDVAAFVTALNALTPKNPYDETYADNGVVADVQVVRGFK